MASQNAIILPMNFGASLYRSRKSRISFATRKLMSARVAVATTMLNGSILCMGFFVLCMERKSIRDHGASAFRNVVCVLSRRRLRVCVETGRPWHEMPVTEAQQPGKPLRSSPSFILIGPRFTSSCPVGAFHLVYSIKTRFLVSSRSCLVYLIRLRTKCPPIRIEYLVIK
jgi:hypothetical protein